MKSLFVTALLLTSATTFAAGISCFSSSLADYTNPIGTPYNVLSIDTATKETIFLQVERNSSMEDSIKDGKAIKLTLVNYSNGNNGSVYFSTDSKLEKTLDLVIAIDPSIPSYIASEGTLSFVDLNTGVRIQDKVLCSLQE